MWQISISKTLDLFFLSVNWIKYSISHQVFIKIFNRILIKGFGNYIPLHIIPNILNEEEIDVVIDEIVNDKNFEKSNTVIETCENIKEVKYPKDYEDGGIFLEDLSEKQMNDPRVQAMFKQSRHKNLSIFIISHDYHGLPKKTIRASGNTYHIFKLNHFRDVKNTYRDKSSVDMTFIEFRYLTNTCWVKKHQPLTIDMTKGKYTCRYRLGLYSLFVPDSSLF